MEDEEQDALMHHIVFFLFCFLFFVLIFSPFVTKVKKYIRYRDTGISEYH